VKAPSLIVFAGVRAIPGDPARVMAGTDPSRGTMLNAAQQFLEQAPWMALWPGLAIFSLALSFNLAGDGLRDALDPRD